MGAPIIERVHPISQLRYNMMLSTRGISRMEVARELGVSGGSVSAWLHSPQTAERTMEKLDEAINSITERRGGLEATSDVERMQNYGATVKQAVARTLLVRGEGHSNSIWSNQGTAPKRIEAKRKCDEKGCRTTLSTYNPNLFCYAHDGVGA